MLCKTIVSKKYWYLLLLTGAVSLVVGTVWAITNKGELNGGPAMLIGMFSGLGAVLFIFSAIRLAYMAAVSPVKLKKEEIKFRDERNIQITRLSLSASGVAATLAFAVLACIFFWLGDIIPAFCLLGAMWLQVLVTVIAHRVYNAKM